MVVAELAELAHPVLEPVGVFCGHVVVDVHIGDAEPQGLYVANGRGQVRMSGPRLALVRMSGPRRCVWRGRSKVAVPMRTVHEKASRLVGPMSGGRVSWVVT